MCPYPASRLPYGQREDKNASFFCGEERTAKAKGVKVVAQYSGYRRVWDKPSASIQLGRPAQTSENVAPLCWRRVNFQDPQMFESEHGTREVEFRWGERCYVGVVISH